MKILSEPALTEPKQRTGSKTTCHSRHCIESRRFAQSKLLSTMVSSNFVKHPISIICSLKQRSLKLIHPAHYFDRASQNKNNVPTRNSNLFGQFLCVFFPVNFGNSHAFNILNPARSEQQQFGGRKKIKSSLPKNVDHHLLNVHGGYFPLF